MQQLRKAIQRELDRAKLPSDVNVRVQANGVDCITSKNKKVIVKGPVFVGIKANIA